MSGNEEQQQQQQSLIADMQQLADETTAASASSLAVDDGNNDHGDGTDGNSSDESTTTTTTPLDRRILDIIGSIPDRTIRPGRLAAELGISVEDASKELSGLLAAVGGGVHGATFRFETVEAAAATRASSAPASSAPASAAALTMVFAFPPDFKQRALRKRRKEDLWIVVQKLMVVAVKVLKIVTAFGLILSLLIVSVAAVVGLIAALVALSRSDGGHRHRNQLLYRVRNIFYTVRQLLWCYALFGPTSDDSSNDGQDPFLREVAYDLWLFFSICCGNPGSIFFWMRASHFQQRRRRYRGFRGWSSTGNAMESDIPGVTLVRRGSDENHRANSNSLMGGAAGQQQPHRGLLSVAVEFLFGPIAPPGPTTSEKWLMRAAAIVQLSTKHQSVSLEDLAPYVDFPPDSARIDASSRLVAQSLLIVSHFNGVPVKSQEKDGNSNDDTNTSVTNARFVFPELMAESTYATHFERPEDTDDGTWQSLLYEKDGSPLTRRRTAGVPNFLKEERCRFSKLYQKQLMHCLVLGCLNLVGVLWFGQSISPGGVIEMDPRAPLAAFLLRGLYPVLKFYALLFFAIPIGRLALIVTWNHFRKQRNDRRARLVARTLGE